MRHFVFAFVVLTSVAFTPAFAATFTVMNTNNFNVIPVNGGGSGIFAGSIATSRNANLTFSDQNGGRLMSGDTVCIATYRNYFVTAEGGGGSVLNANRSECGAWEKFRTWLIDSWGRRLQGQIVLGARVAFQASRGQFVTVERDRSGSMVATRWNIGVWEQFFLRQPYNF